MSLKVRVKKDFAAIQKQKLAQRNMKIPGVDPDGKMPQKYMTKAERRSESLFQSPANRQRKAVHLQMEKIKGLIQ